MKALLLIGMIVMVGCGKKTETIVGTPGSDGQSCYSDTVEGGVNITCGDDVEFISNGTDGVDGVDGSFDGYLEYVIICEDIPGSYQETLLLLDGKYMAFLSSRNHSKQRLVILEEDTLYKTTDNRRVSFIIVDGEIDCSLNN